MAEARRIYIRTLGCPKNEVDSEVVAGSLESADFDLTSHPDEADIIIVNSCGFIQEAKEESIQTTLSLSSLKQKDKSKKLILYGCLGQRYRSELPRLLPEVDVVFGVEEIDSLVRYCKDGKIPEAEEKRELPASYREYPDRRIARDRPYAYLKISEGCDNRCSYCAIPNIRGPLRSRPVERIVSEAQSLVDAGVRELILIAQDTTSYGIDLYGRPELVRLLREISEIEALKWIRILYAQPMGVDDGLIGELAENGKICKYLDLPLQHVSDKILRSMNRKVTKRQIHKLVERLRSQVPGIALRTTLMVGFPGETETDFKELLSFVEEARFDHLGAFAYSREEGTEAYSLARQLPRKVKEERLDLLMTIQSDIIFEANEKRRGNRSEVLVEKEEESGVTGRWICRSEHQAPEVDSCFLVAGSNLKRGDFVQVEVVGWEAYDLIAEPRARSKVAGPKSRATREQGETSGSVGAGSSSRRGDPRWR
jgi:ribosomal protein S12 methylthiotransferase